MKHWTENEFQEWMFGLKEPDSHIEGCAECAGEMARLEAERRRATAQPEVSHEFLAAQRRGIYRRIAEPPRYLPARWALPAATALVVMLSLLAPRWHKQAPTMSDDQLFADLAAIEQRAEPQAIQPIHGLFEE